MLECLSSSASQYKLGSWIHTYHSRFIPEGVAEASRIFLPNAHVLPKLLAMTNTADVTGGKPIAVSSQSYLRSNCYFFSRLFMTSMEELFCPEHHTKHGSWMSLKIFSNYSFSILVNKYLTTLVICIVGEDFLRAVPFGGRCTCRLSPLRTSSCPSRTLFATCLPTQKQSFLINY
jgi:hypothetical protein